LLKPGWQVSIADMVLHELTRNETPTRDKLTAWIAKNGIPLRSTRVFAEYSASSADKLARKANLGEFATQEIMNGMALASPQGTGVFLFEDHRIARTSFLLPDNCRKVSTRAFLIFLEERGWIASANDIERRAILAGRTFSSLRFPP
jgi:hypothetical protein